MEQESCCGKKNCPHGGMAFFGRLLLSIIFIVAGLGKIVDFQAAADSLRAYGIQGAQTYIFIGLLMELVGGILLLLGWHTRLGIYLLMIFLLPTTLIVHGFWSFEGEEMMMQFSQFLKNLAIYGGLLAFLSFGPGRWSVDAARKASH